MSWTCTCGTATGPGHQYGCTGELPSFAEHFGPYRDPFECGAAVAFGLMGMAEAIGETDSVRACAHCGTASADRVYCECSMCEQAVCLYWICRPCFDNGRGFDAVAAHDRSKDR